MTKEQLDLYAPANAKNLSPEQIAAMADFSKEDLKELAAAYPNNSHSSAYLILFERGVAANKQVGHPSTWNNLYQLIKMGGTKYYAASFRSIYKQAPIGGAIAKPVQKAKDITNDEAKELLKGAGNQKAKEVKEGTGKAETAEEIAAREAREIGDGKKAEKPLNKMNLTELTAKYKEVFEGEEPEPGSTKAQLIAAIESKE